MFKEWGNVRETGKHGNTTFYVIDESSSLVKSMKQFNAGRMENMFPELFEGPSAPFVTSQIRVEDAPNTPNT